MRVALRSLGCRVNEAELQRWSRDFSERGHEVVESTAPADLIVLNSCAVTSEAVRKSRQMLRRLRRRHPEAKVVLTGCYATLDRKDAEGLGIDLLVVNADKDRLPEIAENELNAHVMPAAAVDPESVPPLPATRQRAFVKVQDGCRYRCTYCIVTIARGEEHSRDADDVVREIDALVRHGVQEIVLTGIHLGGYGATDARTLTDLIRHVLDRTGLRRLRLGSLEPWDLPAEFFSLFDDPRMMPHLHLPLQSGCDEVLRGMARRCKTADFAGLVATARERVPHINITTDIIVGFPGETERHWQQSLAFIDAMAFGHIHVFPFSPRAGTRAASLPDQVAETDKRRRCGQLHESAAMARRAFQTRFVGRRFPVLIEGSYTEGTPAFGYTPNYLRVAIDRVTADFDRNHGHDRIVDVLIEGYDDRSGQLVGTG